MDTCAVCGELAIGKNVCVIGAKGAEGINKASQKRGDQIRTTEGQKVHIACRRKYTHPRVIEAAVREHEVGEGTSVSRTLRSESSFDFKKDCLLCGKPTETKGRRSSSFKVFPVRTENKFFDGILKLCSERNDTWSQSVRGRLEFARDLHAQDALYHQQCSVNFRTGKNIPLVLEDEPLKKKAKVGRPQDDARAAAFTQVLDYFVKNDEEHLTIADLVSVMAEFTTEPYSIKHMKRKLIEHYGDQVFISEIDGKSDVVTLRKTAASILYEFHAQQVKTDPDTEKLNIIKTAAQLLKADIKALPSNKAEYPSSSTISSPQENSAFMPQSLSLFLGELLVGTEGDIKLSSLAQALMQATRPRALLCPLQFGLGVQMHHHFGSRFLIDTLNKLGFSSSYSEVKRFESCAAVALGTEIPQPQQDSFVQFVADNVDHNIQTIDGRGTFHGMGIIAATTPAVPFSRRIARKQVSAKEVAAIGSINVRFYKPEERKDVPLQYKPLPALACDDPTSAVDILWKTTWLLRNSRPSWSGFMQATHTEGEHAGISSITFLPLIDIDPNDLTCIYSTLLFVAEQSKVMQVTPVVTFDQPLFWKAKLIIASEPDTSVEIKSIVIRLGGFHVQMSFLGAVGYVMQGSGLEQLLEVVYAGNTVPHILSGKAFARASRAHNLVDTALTALLISELYDLDLRENQTDEPEPHDATDEEEATSDSETSSVEQFDTENPVSEESSVTVLQAAAKLLDGLLAKDTSLEEVCKNDDCKEIAKMFAAQKQDFVNGKFLTAQLWIIYMDMIAIWRRFVKAERTGNWKLHLSSMQEMLPYFAATGHTSYLKSCHLYLLHMSELEVNSPAVYNAFMAGHHTIRRSDRYWAGLSTDLVIEQVLMRSIKSTGGLTRGRGITDSQRALWILSMPACAAINDAMQKLTGCSYASSFQHIDSRTARKTRDQEDTISLVNFLNQRNPFEGDVCLRNIVTGVVADAAVNVHRVKEVGEKIMTSMLNKTVTTCSIPRKARAVNMAAKTCIKISGEPVLVDSRLLFQRLVTAAKGSIEDLDSIFSFELCSYPTSLFESSGFMLTANKAAFAQAINKTTNAAAIVYQLPTESMTFVLDGGSLLQRLPWARGKTFGDICTVYTHHLSKYPGATIVFDGYPDAPSTKDQTHMRRNGGAGVKVLFTPETALTSSKEVFLSNLSNKQDFISLLSTHLQKANYSVVQAEGDADTLIASTATEKSKYGPTVLIGEDTDLLVLLCHHADDHSKGLFMMSEIPKKPIWDILRLKAELREKSRHLLFAHAFLGCDTTSRVFGFGKGVALKMLDDNSFIQAADTFMTESSKEEVTAAGEKAFLGLYGAPKFDSLNKLRVKRFYEKVPRASIFVEPQSLPPTTAAAKFHSLRVYHQTQVWMGNTDLQPTDWGWKEEDGCLWPIQTDQPPAPEPLLTVIRCACRTDCSTARCTCRKHGLSCSYACKACSETNCTNNDREEQVDDDPEGSDD